MKMFALVFIAYTQCCAWIFKCFILIGDIPPMELKESSMTFLSPFPRRRESMQRIHRQAITKAQWIPACAGMTA
ncbi:MAG: hypothetical protein LBI48_10315 [Burkholderiaceae bacterium]|nr:hypothetical protein [Burkholderiaceae bacterium]